MLLFYISMLESDTDKERFALIYQDYHDKMLKIALNILKSYSLAEDAVHDSFLKIIKHFDKVLEIPCNELEPWIVTIVKHTALDSLKHEKRHTNIEDAEAFDIIDAPDWNTEYDYLIELIRAMSPTYRTVLELKFVAQWSMAEIAQELDLSENVVGVRIHRGRNLLIEKLKEEGYAL